MQGTISNFVIPGITYTKIMEVYPMAEESTERNDLIDQGYVSVGMRPQETAQENEEAQESHSNEAEESYE